MRSRWPLQAFKFRVHYSVVWVQKSASILVRLGFRSSMTVRVKLQVSAPVVESLSASCEYPGHLVPS